MSSTRNRILEAASRLMLEAGGQPVPLRDIAKAAGISRQALYLHYASRLELVVATVHYVDEQNGLDQQLERFHLAGTGSGKLIALVEVWGHYIPRIHGLAHALLLARETDEAAAAAWDGCMLELRSACLATVEHLHEEGHLRPELTPANASDLLWALLSVRNWELLTQDCGWTETQFVDTMLRTLQAALTI